jgi:hypothetical protein
VQGAIETTGVASDQTSPHRRRLGRSCHGYESEDAQGQVAQGREEAFAAEARRAGTGLIGPPGFVPAETAPRPQPPSTARQWVEASIKPPTLLLGQVWHDQQVAMFTMDTGRGKSMWAFALGLAIAYGREFCGWQPLKPGRTLYIDGEMPAYSVQRYLQAQCAALGVNTKTVYQPFICLSRKTEKFPPLNDAKGREWLFEQIRLYRPNFIIFDNVLTLAPDMASASMRGWMTKMVDPLINEINKMHIGQLWVHHTGKNKRVSFGTKDHEITLECHIMGDAVKGRGIGFNIKFVKGRGDDTFGDDWQPKYIAFERENTDDPGRWIVMTPQMTEDAEKKKPGRPNESDAICLDALKLCHEEMPDAEYIPLFTWRTKATEQGISTSENRQSIAMAFRRSREHLIRNGWVAENSNGDGSCKVAKDDNVTQLRDKIP